MIVYGSLASLFVQRVLMAARAKGHELAAEPPPGGSLRSPEFQAISPTGRIPLLRLDDGSYLCESDAIVSYLDETLTGPSLTPTDTVARARMRAAMAIGTDIAAGLRPLLIHLVFRRGDGPEVDAAARQQIERGLDSIGRFRNSGDVYAVGDSLTQADCLLLPVLALAEIIDPLAGTGSMVRGRPGVAAYYDRFAGNDLVARTASEMKAALAQFLAREPA